MVPSLEKGVGGMGIEGKDEGSVGGKEIDCICGQVPQGII